MGNYQSLDVWKTAHRLTLAVYSATRGFPSTEKFGLTSQLRRAAASVSANIAEGCGRNSDKELARFCRISLGSANELEYHLLLARDLGLLAPESYKKLNADVWRTKRMLAALVGRVG